MLRRSPEPRPTLEHHQPSAGPLGRASNSTADSIADTRDEELASNPRYLLHTLKSRFLRNQRTISVYLPAQYSRTTQRFPVFYLHDGQNLFDGRTSYIPGCTWNVHTTADRLTESGEIEPVILVGVANSGTQRMSEYTPTANSNDPKTGGGNGDLYGRLLIEELKPLIDREYRTLPGPAHTGLGGSSLGGLISLYLGLRHPDVFSGLAVMSPSLWWNRRSILDLVRNSTTPRPNLRIWLDMGTAEGASHLRDADTLEQILVARGWRHGIDLAYEKAEGAVHDETAWSDRFGDVLRFLFRPTP